MATDTGARSGLRGRRLSICAALMLLLAVPASAMTVVYGWTPDSGQLGSGSLTISDPAIADASNFSVGPGALIGLTYTWNNGATINLGSVLTNNATAWTACAGVLINNFQITANSVPSFPGTYALSNSLGSCFPTFPPFPLVIPGPGSNGTTSAHYGSETNAGHWTFSSVVVPVPGAVWLLGSAIAAMLGLRRRQTV